MIKKLDSSFVNANMLGLGHLANKINEIIDAITSKPAPYLVCSSCGSEKWQSMHSSTLMGGPMNYYTYTCSGCGKSTKVKRIRRTDPRVYLGPEDEVMK
jgi:hypothetical protein